jgi:nucleoside-diphosphate-sugar epimerase
MKIFVTGATGYVGHELALTLAQQGNDIQILVRNPHSANIPQHVNITAFIGDITNRPTLTAAIKGCEYIYHTAALVGLSAWDHAAFYQVNTEGTKNVLEEALELGVKKIVYTSSCGVMGPSINEPRSENDPRITGFDNDYEFSKFMAENLVKEFNQKGLSTVIVCPSKVYGPGIDTHPVTFNMVMKNFINGRITFIPKPGHFVGNYCFISDVVQGHILAMEKGVGGEKYILGGANVSYLKLFQTLRLLSGSKALLVETPISVMKAWAHLQWLLSKITRKELFYTAKSLHHLFCNKAYSSNKAIGHIGYQPVSLEEGLQQTIHFLNQQ